MKRLVALLFILLLPLVGASTFTGYIGVSSTVGVGNYTVTVKDVSLDDGSLLLDVSTPNWSGMKKLPLGSVLSLGELNLTFEKVFLGSRSLVFLSAQFPYVLPGQNVTLGPYTIEVLSVGKDGVELKVTYGNESKTFKSSFKFENLVANVSGFLPVYSGYLKLNESFSFAGETVTFTGAKVENATSGFIETVFFSYDNTTYALPVGNESVIGPFLVKVDDLIGLNYTKVDVHFLGVSMNLTIVPNEVFSLAPGQTKTLGPYVFRYDYHLGNKLKVSLLNPCQVVLASTSLIVSNVSTLLYHKGLTVIPLSIDANGTAQFASFINPNELPSPDKVANVLVSLRDGNARQYLPTTLTVEVENTGNVALSNLTVKFVPGDVKVLSETEFFLKSLTPGEKKEFKLAVLPMKSGNVSAGRVTVTAMAPYELACGGYTLLKFSSNELTLNVKPTRVEYSLRVSAPANASLYRPVNLTVVVRNTGDETLPANLTLTVPPGVAMASSGNVFASGSRIVLPLYLPPGNESVVSFVLIPYTPGEKSFKIAVVSVPGVVNETGLSITVLSAGTEKENQTAPTTFTTTKTITERINSTVTITVTKTQTEIKTKTVTSTTTSSVPYTPLKTKLIWLVIGVVIGAGIIIAIAWYQARSS
ncbi:Putative membrane protein, conserved [Thermococcus nautili]|uniref:hypothetical protein n=1 Tax=Thermococcus nautili TaxID=195522 RepID=UPI00255409AC|nr:hypothetical protein [Thermococcus nautili]CAI1493194.1 Putative membrane protein, conserved [Thermococcus nautili]